MSVEFVVLARWPSLVKALDCSPGPEVRILPAPLQIRNIGGNLLSQIFFSSYYLGQALSFIYSLTVCLPLRVFCGILFLEC